MSGWRPGRTRNEELDRAIRSMIPGSWQGKVAQAMPVRTRILSQVESLDEETLDSIVATMKAEANDAHIVTANNVASGSATILLTYKPIDESVKLWWGGEFQSPTEYTTDYVLNEVTIGLPDYVEEGDLLWVHYWYLEQDPRGPEGYAGWPFGDTGWKNQSGSGDLSSPALDDSGWAVGTAPFGYKHPLHPNHWSTATSGPTLWSSWWFRRRLSTGTFQVTVRKDDDAYVYRDGVLVETAIGFNGDAVVTVVGPCLVAIKVVDTGGDVTYFDCEAVAV